MKTKILSVAVLAFLGLYKVTFAQQLPNLEAAKVEEPRSFLQSAPEQHPVVQQYYEPCEYDDDCEFYESCRDSKCINSDLLLQSAHQTTFNKKGNKKNSLECMRGGDRCEGQTCEVG